ncbi:hypothetical protein NHQ30_004422 [Ciborinia camelliae]|nr:hypothetical protein NHQ30_004422 [Ciborinia camelliae]
MPLKKASQEDMEGTTRHQHGHRYSMAGQHPAGNHHEAAAVGHRAREIHIVDGVAPGALRGVFGRVPRDRHAVLGVVGGDLREDVVVVELVGMVGMVGMVAGVVQEAGARVAGYYHILVGTAANDQAPDHPSAQGSLGAEYSAVRYILMYMYI